MKTVFTYIIMFCLALLPALVQSQNNNTLLRIRVDSVIKKGDSLYAIVAAGTRMGMHEGSTGIFLNAEKPRPSDFHEVATARVAMLDEYSSIVAIYSKGQANSVKAGSMLRMAVDPPARKYPNIFLDLAMLDIYFRNFETKEIFYTLEELVRDDEAGKQEEISKRITGSTENLYDRIRDINDATVVYNRIVPEGRYKGKSLKQLLQHFSSKDVYPFARYVRNYPGLYIGQDLVFVETFGGWFYSNAPYSPDEVKDALFPVYKNAALLKAKLKTYVTDIRRENMGLRFATEASELFDQGRAAESAAMMDFATAITEMGGDDNGRASVHLLKAQILQDRELYAAAAIESEKCITICKRHLVDTAADYKDFRHTEIMARIKKGYCEYKAGANKAARQTLDELTTALHQYRQAIGEEEYLSTMSSRYSYGGYFDYLAKDYNHALINYQYAILVNDSIHNGESVVSNADMLVQVGKILVSQQKFAEGIEDFNEAAKIYNDAGLPGKAEGLLTETGLAWYEAGDYKKALQLFNQGYDKAIAVRDSSNAGYLQSLIGISLSADGQSDKSMTAHRTALLLRKNDYGKAYSWHQIGSLYKNTGRKNEALAALDSSIYYYRLTGDSTNLPEVYTLKGKVYVQDQQYTRAIRELEKAVKMPGGGTPETLYELAGAWLLIDTAKAKGVYINCLQAATHNGDKEYEYLGNLMLAKIFYRIHEDRQGEQYVRRVEQLVLSGKTSRRSAELFTLKAFISSIRLDADSALGYYRQAYAIYDSIDKYTAVDILAEISFIHVAQGNMVAASEVLQRAATQARSIGGNMQLGTTLLQASYVKSIEGDYAMALAYNDSALAIFRASGNDFTVASTLVSRGGMLSVIGKYADAVTVLMRADSIYQSQQAKIYQFSILNNIAVAYYSQGDYVNAIKNFRKLEAQLIPGVVNEDLLFVKSNLSEAYYDNRQFAEAEKAASYYAVGRKKGFHRLTSVMALTLGKLAYDKKDYGKVQEYVDYVKSVSMMGGNRSLSDVYVLEGKTAARLNKHKEASAAFDQATAVAAQYNIGSQGWISFYEAGLYYYERGMYDSAINRLKIAVDRVEQGSENLLGGAEGKLAYNNDPRKVSIYSMLTSSLIKTNREKEAFAYANRSNITGLQVLNGPALVQGDESKQQALQGLGELQQKKEALEKSALQASSGAGVSKSKLVAIQAQTKVLEAEYSKYVEDLIAKYPDIGMYFQRNANPDDFYNYKGELPDDMAVLLYLPNGNDLMIFSLTNEDLSVQVVEMKDGINTAISAFKSLTKNRGKSSGTGPVHVRSEVIDEEPLPANVSFKDVSGELYALLIGSVRDKIGTKKKICIIPNGNLSNLPFQCLGSTGPDGSFHFLLEDYAIFYTNQLDVFKGSRGSGAAKKPMGTFAAFGVPDQTLRFNLDEVKTIGHIVGSDSTVYADGRATESAARLSLMNKKVIHFATHGTLNYNQYSQSYLKFLPDRDTSGGRDGRLTIDEIKKMLIPGCDLVTLSACETAVNNQLVKGWNISPANAFLQRKVKSVVASLWKVDDEATSLLMKGFYQNLSDGMEKAEALRRAQETLSHDPKYAHPYFWGAFVLFGDWR